MGELFASGIKLAYTAEINFIFENGDHKKVSKLKINLAKCPMNAYSVCLEWRM